jgi:diguanylate cyclase (GGDEF)-like protein
MLDIDHFKRVNDTYGHPAGDMALRTIATLLTDGLRPSDTLARYGGEEIVALLPETDENAALVIAERLRQSVASRRIGDGEVTFAVTVSVGLARWQQFEPTIDATLARADRALYRVKNGGRNGVMLELEQPKISIES